MMATPPAVTGGPTGPASVPVTGAGRTRFLRGLRSGQARAGLLVVGLLYLAGLAAPLLTWYAPDQQSALALAGPSGDHLLGTDELGRDLWSRVVYGIRIDIFVTLVAVPAGALIGTALGLVSGIQRVLDQVIQRLFDTMLGFTALVLGVTVAAIVGQGTSAIVLTIIGINIPIFGRITRDQVVAQRERDYVVAAGVIGAGRPRLLLRHILPNIVDALIVQMALAMSVAVFIEGAMSLLGLGVRPPAPSLGSVLGSSVNFLYQNPAYAIGPMIVVTALVVGFNLVADGLNRGLLRQ